MVNKKTYFQPTTQCVKMTPRVMISASSIGFGSGEKRGSDAAARDNNGWDIWGDNDNKWENE